MLIVFNSVLIFINKVIVVVSAYLAYLLCSGYRCKVLRLVKQNTLVKEQAVSELK